MESSIQKWGNSLAIRIPAPLAKEAGISEGAPVTIGVSEGCVVISPIHNPRYSLEELLEGVTRSNIHRETDWGGPAGREVL
ncbi:MAG: AbrB/MazE/SpoVT family DNA-binding domain-containing protein [FCB group bacterium]|nr:AbrB/MazE/SpoVT family DNA-binding domain-containing protein [FCB group bacterium]